MGSLVFAQNSGNPHDPGEAGNPHDFPNCMGILMMMILVLTITEAVMAHTNSLIEN